MRTRIVAIMALCIASGVSAAQTDTNTSRFDVNGLDVILRRNSSNEVISANLFLLGGTQQLSPATQGIESFLLEASERGTHRFPGSAVRKITAALGSTFTIDPSADWTTFGFTSIRSTFDSTWSIFADRVMAPTLDSTEVELVRARLITAARAELTDPDPLVNHLADSLAYVGHPYAFDPTGTETTLRSISLAALRRYEAAQMVTSRMLLVVVGSIDRAHLEPLVQRTLAQLPHGNYAWRAPGGPRETGRALVLREAQLPTNYILGYYAGPRAGTPDYPALRIATAVLSGRFFTEIRSRRNLSYEVDAPFVERAIANGGVYVTTVDPNATLTLMRSEIDRLQRELIDPAGLERLVQQFITDYFLKNETDRDQAAFLARAQIYDRDYREASRFVDELRRVTPEDVRRAAVTYMHDFRFVYLGNAASLDRTLLAQF